MGALSTTKILKNSGGDLVEETTLTTSVGVADANKVPALNASGVLDPSIINASVTASPNKIPQLNASGTLDVTLMPPGVGADTAPIIASEALAAGDVVNVWDNGGTANVRKADAATNKRGNGFVLASVAASGLATVYFESTNNQCTGLTPGDVYLSSTVPGRTTSTPPTGSGVLQQLVGFAISSTAFNFQYNRPIILA
jgi:hypothetical protein